MAKHIVRIENDIIRILLLICIFPFLMVDFAIGLARNQPNRFFTLPPWRFTFQVWFAAGAGAFVGLKQP